MTAAIPLPDSLNINTAPGFLGQIVGVDRRPLHPSISISFERLSWVEATGVTILSNVTEWLRRRDVFFGFDKCDPGRQAVRYLDDCGFFQAHLGKPLRANAQLRSTTFPVKVLARGEGFSWVTNEMIPWAASKVHKDPRALASLSVSVRELLNNIADHAREEIGCIHVQHYPNRGSIAISVSDMGVGIPTARREAFEIDNDGEAIFRATELGVTSKKGGRNQGVGLDALLKDVVGQHSGTVNIASNRGYLQCFKQGGTICRLARQKDQTYPGTVFEIVVPASALEVDTNDEDVSW